MKRILILLGLTNVCWGLMILLLLYRAEDKWHPVPLAIIVIYFATGLGLILKNKIAWTVNYLLGALTVFVVLFSFAITAFRETDIVFPWTFGRISISIGVFCLMGLTIFSLVRAIQKDIVTHVNVSHSQKRLTIIVAVILPIVWAGLAAAT